MKCEKCSQDTVIIYIMADHRKLCSDCRDDANNKRKPVKSTYYPYKKQELFDEHQGATQSQSAKQTEDL